MESICNSQEYLFAEDIVYCINFHFSDDIGSVSRCINPKTRKSLLTPNLEKNLVKLLFYHRKTFLKRFHNYYKNEELTLTVFKKDLEEGVQRSMSYISECHKKRQKYDADILIMQFFNHCIELASMAVLFHRGGKALGSLNHAISVIYQTIKKFQALAYFNTDTWGKLDVWEAWLNHYCPNSALGLEEVSSDENNFTLFKFIEPRTQSDSSVSSTNDTSDVVRNPFKDESMTLEEMIRIATHVEKNYFLNFNNRNHKK